MEGYRKFVFCLCVFIPCLALVIAGKLPPDNFDSIAWGVLLAFSGGNVGEWLGRRK